MRYTVNFFNGFKILKKETLKNFDVLDNTAIFDFNKNSFATTFSKINN